MFAVVTDDALMTRTHITDGRIDKNGRASAKAASPARLAARAKSGGRKRAAVTPAKNDLPMKSIGEIAAAIVARLAAQRRDA